MALETVKSSIITNRDATPQVLNDAGINGGLVRSAVAMVEVSAAANSGSTYIMFPIPSNASNLRVWVVTDDLGTSTITADVGLYQTTANGSAAVDADFFANALDLADPGSGSLTLTGLTAQGIEITHSNAYGIDDVEKPLWEALGLSADSQRDYDVVVTMDSGAAVDTGGTIVVKATWVV